MAKVKEDDRKQKSLILTGENCVMAPLHQGKDSSDSNSFVCFLNYLNKIFLVFIVGGNPTISFTRHC